MEFIFSRCSVFFYGNGIEKSAKTMDSLVVIWSEFIVSTKFTLHHYGFISFKAPSFDAALV